MTTNPSLTETAWSQCEAVIRQFEAAWRAGQPPDPATFVPADSPLRVRLLVELVHVDLEFRLRANEDARVEDYIQRFPELSGKDLTLDLIAAEYALRTRYSPPVAPAEFWLRFPKHEAELRALLTASAPGFQLTREAPGQPARPLDGPPLIPGCQIQGELGRGGMGVVYKARDLLLNRTVAVKTMATVPASEARARFAREAESIARLDHPNIVPVYEIGEWGPEPGPKVPFFTMKFYPGGSLDAAPAGSAANPVRQAELMETIARAVHHAHRRGVLHLDLKPSNILLDDAGQPHVADFGLAGWFDPTDPRSVLGGAVGTPAYMAPEQARPAGRVTLAADVYGLGAVLYHLLAGRPPFLGPTAIATLDLVMRAAPDRPSATNPDIPLDLEAVCLKCLDKEPAKRYHTAEEVADDLARWRAGRPVLARPAPMAERAWLLVRRHPLIAVMGVTTFAALVAAVIVLAVSNDQVREKEQAAQAALEREREAHKVLSESLDREQWLLYLERVAAAGRLYQMNHLEQAWHTLDQCPLRYREWEWQYLNRVRNATPAAWRGSPNGVYAVAFLADGRLVTTDSTGEARVWSPDGTSRAIRDRAGQVVPHPARNWVAFSDEGGGVSVWDVDANQLVRKFDGREWKGFSPDGSIFAQARDSAVYLWKTDTWEPAGELRGHSVWVSCGAFTPDGNTLYTGGRDMEIRAWDLTTGRQVGEPRKRPYPLLNLVLSADGKTLFEGMPSRVQVSDAATGQVIRVATPAPGWPCVVAGPDAAWYAATASTGEVVVRDTATGQPLRSYRGHPTTPLGLALDRTGTRLASCDADGLIRVTDATATPEFTDFAAGDRFGSLSITTDGKRLLIGPRAFHNRGEEAIRVLDLATGRELVRVGGSGEAAMDPVGRWLVTNKPTAELVLRDAATGAELRTLAAKLPATRIRFSPDGRRLAVADLNRTVRIWDTGTWAEPEPLLQADSAIYAIAWSPSGEYLAVTRPQGVELWSPATRTAVRLIPTDQPAVGVAFSPAGDTLAIVGRGRILMLYDLNAAQLIRPLIGNPSVVNALAFHPRGNRLASAGQDGWVRVWDVDSGQQVLALPAGEKDLFALQWTPDGQQLLAAGDVVRSWRK